MLDKPENPFSFDVFVNEQGHVIDSIITYGRWGKINGRDMWPFVLRPSKGKGEALLDFGESEDDPIDEAERYGWTNLTAKKIVVGELATVRYFEDEYCCRIVSVKALPSGEDFIAL